MVSIIRRIGLEADIFRLEYGDACFEGNGPNGTIAVGIERKTLHDMLNCIEDARYAAYQRPGMMQLYSKSFLFIEGLWEPGEGGIYTGKIMQGFRKGQSWGPLKTAGNRQVLYSKLFRYLVSVALSGVVVIPSYHIVHTAYNICELYHYFSKPWRAHTSLIECQKLAIPDLRVKPPLVRRWANELEEIGVVFSLAAEEYFKTPIRLANSDESDWVRLVGEGNKHLGIGTAQKIVKEIRGWK